MGLVLLSDLDVAYVQMLREKGVLEDIQTERMPCSNGTIVVPCADGHHFRDFYEHHRLVCRMDAEDPMHHPLSLCGGALLIPVDSPMLTQEGIRCYDDETLLRHIVLSYRVKHAEAVILAAHAPCGMAQTYGLSIEDCLELLVKAKDRVRAKLLENDIHITVSGHFHAYYETGGVRKRLSYHLDRSQWNAMKNQLSFAA